MIDIPRIEDPVRESYKTRHVFISYSHDDRDKMGSLDDMLVAYGIPAWTDISSIKSGTAEWMHRIQDALDSAYAVVVLCSTSARNSKWVTRELLYADDNDIPILPVL